MANTYLTRTPSSSGNRLKWTWSGWAKRGTDNQDLMLFSAYQNSSYNTYLKFALGGEIRFADVYNGSDQAKINTLAKFRDLSSWYHLVLVYDKNNSTSTDRLILYVNGVRITDFDGSIMPSQSTTFNVDNVAMQLGAFNAGSKFNGLMSHVHFSDGYALAPTVFGETDATTGEWKIKTSPSFTLGTNGFTILKDGNTITDQSSNSNNFSLGGGTLTKTEDCPSNVFATFNPLDNYYPAMTLSYGNTRALTIGGKYTYTPTTLGMTSGKHYAEIKCTAQSGSQNEFTIGITSTSSGSTTEELGHYANDYGYNGVAGNYRTNNGNTSYGASFTTGDIIGIAVDLDNNKLYFSKNGTFQNSGNPASGSTGTGAISITDPTLTSRGAYFFAVGYYSSSIIGTFDANFGNGYFGTTAVSSAGSNASGNGIFEYDCPTGYTALSTKGLNL